MLMKNLEKIDKFYYIFGLTVLILIAVIIVTINGVFGAIEKSQNITEKVSGGQPLNEEKLNKAYQELDERKIIPLDIRF